MVDTKSLEIKGEIKKFTPAGLAKCGPITFEKRFGELLFVLGYYAIETTPNR